MKKTCDTCLIEKDLEEFYKSKSNKSGFRGDCKECSKRKAKRYKTPYKDLSNAKKLKVRTRMYKFQQTRLKKIIDGMPDSCCKECSFGCGRGEWRVLRFAHRNPDDKVFDPKYNLSRRMGELLNEVEKCFLLCPNHWAMRKLGLPSEWKPKKMRTRVIPSRQDQYEDDEEY